jgi:hypothetical protein
MFVAFFHGLVNYDFIDFFQKPNVSNKNTVHCGTHFDAISEEQKQALHEEFGFKLSGKVPQYHYFLIYSLLVIFLLFVFHVLINAFSYIFVPDYRWHY